MECIIYIYEFVWFNITLSDSYVLNQIDGSWFLEFNEFILIDKQIYVLAFVERMKFGKKDKKR